MNLELEPRNPLRLVDQFLDVQNSKTPEEYFKLLKDASEEGSLAAFYELAWCYRKGFGTELDKQKSFNAFRKAAEKGYTSAELEVGYCYYRGEGVDRSYKDAFRIFEDLSKRGGFPAATFALGNMYQNGEGVEKDPTMAFKYYKLAAEKEFVHAIFKVGQYYQSGLGGNEKNLELAKDYFAQAALLKHKEAANELSNVKEILQMRKRSSQEKENVAKSPKTHHNCIIS